MLEILLCVWYLPHYFVNNPISSLYCRCKCCHIITQILLTLSLISIWARFLCWMRMVDGGCIQASPSTWTGTPSWPRIVTVTLWHCRNIHCSSLAYRTHLIEQQHKTSVIDSHLPCQDWRPCSNRTHIFALFWLVAVWLRGKELVLVNEVTYSTLDPIVPWWDLGHLTVCRQVNHFGIKPSTKEDPTQPSALRQTIKWLCFRAEYGPNNINMAMMNAVY